jgi:hypothetical protein
MSIAYTDIHDEIGATIRTRTTINTPENYPREVCGEQPHVSLCPTSEGGANFITDGVKGVRDWYVIVDVGARRCTSTLVLDSVEEASKCSPPAQRIRITAACLTPLRTCYMDEVTFKGSRRNKELEEALKLEYLEDFRRFCGQMRTCAFLLKDVGVKVSWEKHVGQRVATDEKYTFTWWTIEAPRWK